MDTAVLETVKQGFTVVFKPDFDIKGTFRLEIYKGGGYTYQTISYDFVSDTPITWENILKELIVQHKRLHGPS